MKKIATIFMALASLAFLSCSKQDIDGAKPAIDPGNPSEVSRVFYAVTPASDSTRTFLDADLQMYWSAGDEISVFGSTVNEEYVFAGRPGEVESRFEEKGGAPTGAHFSRNYAVYPYNASNSCAKEGELNVILPAEQSYVEGGFGVGDNTMVAVTENWDDNTLKFRNTCGYIMLKLYGGDIIRTISFHGNNAEKLAGKALIKAGYGTAPVITMSDGATTEITMDCGEEGVATGTDKNKPTTFLFVVPPTTFEKGFTFEIVNTTGGHTAVSTAKSLTVSQNKVKQMAAVKVDCMHGKDIISFALTDGTNSYPAFEIGSNTISVQVPNGTDMTGLKAVFSHTGAKVTVGGVEQTSGENGHDFSDFCNPVKYTVTAGDGSSKDYEIRMFNLPIVFATTPNGQPITSKTVWTENCSFKIREADGTLTDFGTTSLKGRGNFSWANYSKKPYAVKFASKPKSSVLGMPAHKRWCLLSNDPGAYFSNQIGFELACRSESLAWSPKSIQVEVFLNGKHLGLYLLTEQIKIDKNRVNITEIGPEDIDGDAVTGGYLLTYDTTYDEPYKFRSQYFNMPVMLKDPDEDVPDAQFNYIQGYINNFEASLKDDSRFAAREYSDYFDMDSYIDMYFVYEMAGAFTYRGNTKYTDFTGPRSVYFYKDRNGIMKAGPVWDFNYCLFERQYILCNKCQYYGRLFQDNYFKARVKQKWLEFRLRTLGKSKYSESIVDFLGRLYSANQAAAKRDYKMNFEGTPVSSVEYHTVEEQYDIIRNGIIPKLEYLGNWINSLPCDYDSFSGSTDDFGQQQDSTSYFNFGF